MANVKMNSGTSYFSEFAMVTVWYMPIWLIQRSLEARSGTWICRNQNKDFGIITETHISHNQIHKTDVKIK